MRRALSFALLVLATTLPAAASPLSDLKYLVGMWNCTYDAGSVHMPYSATYSYDRDGNTLRQVASFGSAGDEELLAFDAQHSMWTAIVLDDRGNATVMHAPGGDPNHIAYRSVYPDASIAPTFDRVSDMKYTVHATVQAGGKTITSSDTCTKGAS